MLQMSRNDLFCGIGSSFVREMPVPSKNPLFKTPWTVRRFLQHPDVVICLEHQHICRPNVLNDEFVRMSEISQKADVSVSGSNEKPDRILRVVRHHECFDAHVADLETAASRHKPAVHPHLTLIFECVLCRSVAINRQPQFFAKGCQPLDMIGVFVRDKNASEALGCTSDCGQPMPDLPGAESGINQNADFIRFEKSAIAG